MASSVVVRQGVLEDLETLTQFNVKMALATENRQLDVDIVRKGCERPLRDPSKGIYVVAEIDGVVHGCCLLTFEWSDWNCKDYLWFQSVFVDEECRGKGIFRKIHEFATNYAKEHDMVPQLRLYVEHDNEVAQTVYKKLGMEQSHYLMFEQL